MAGSLLSLNDLQRPCHHDLNANDLECFAGADPKMHTPLPQNFVGNPLVGRERLNGQLVAIAGTEQTKGVAKLPIPTHDLDIKDLHLDVVTIQYDLDLSKRGP